jgi:hypothetical protein
MDLVPLSRLKEQLDNLIPGEQRDHRQRFGVLTLDGKIFRDFCIGRNVKDLQFVFFLVDYELGKFQV